MAAMPEFGFIESNAPIGRNQQLVYYGSGRDPFDRRATGIDASRPAILPLPPTSNTAYNPAMADQPARRRRWFQLHLSTAILVMILAGVLIGANVMPRSFVPSAPKFYAYGDLDGIVLERRGWPYAFHYDFHPTYVLLRETYAEMEKLEADVSEAQTDAEAILKRLEHLELKRQALNHIKYDLTDGSEVPLILETLALDACIALAILSATMVAWEYRIRRRDLTRQ